MRENAPALLALVAGGVLVAILAATAGGKGRAEAPAPSSGPARDAGSSASLPQGRFPEGVYVRSATYAAEKLKRPYEAIKPLFELKRAPGPSDWLALHPERGQTYAEYVDSHPKRPSGGRNAIYLQVIGRMSAAQAKVIRETARYLSVFFELNVHFLDPLPDSIVPPSAKRMKLSGSQYRTDFLLFRVLEPLLPDDAMAVVGFTATDLYPDPAWNFVFGQSSFDRRVAVFSLARMGDPAHSAAAYRKCLERTSELAAHELGHAFSMPHCVAYECLMNGSNGMFELDPQPGELCPVCAQKLCANVECTPVEHFRRLEQTVRAMGLEKSAERYRDMARLAAAAQ